MNEHVEIIVVENSPTQAMKLRYLLEKNGYSISVTRNGKEALAAIRKHKPKMVISAIVMPEMDGYELCRQIKADEQIKNVPIILLTSLSDPQDIILGMESGANNFIAKPYEEEFLLSRIRYILANQELRKVSMSEMGIEILFGGKKYFLTPDRIQIIDLLLSTYEAAVQKNRELERTQASYRTVLETNADAVIVVDHDRLICFVNPAAEILFDRSSAELIGETFEFPLVAGESTELTITRQSGKTAIAEMRVVETNWQGEDAYLASLRDITERKRAEEEIQQRNRQLSLLHQISQMFSSSLKLNHVLETVLNEVQRLLDVFSVSFWLLDQTTGELVCAHAKGPGSGDLIRQRLAIGQGITGWAAQYNESVLILDTYTDERHIKNVDRQTGVEIRSMISIPLRVKGNVIGVLNLVDSRVGHFTQSDLTLLEPIAATAATAIENAHLYTMAQQEIIERKQAEEAAEAANRAKSTFLANMSHELRTPLNAVLGFAQVLARSHNLDPEQLDNLAIIQRSGEHLLTLINDVLDMSKIEAGRTTLNKGNFDLYCMLDDVVNMFQLKAEKKGLQLRFNRAPDVPRHVQTDEVKLRQVLINLLGNAMKFTEEGEVTLKIEDCRLNIEKSQEKGSGQSSIFNLQFSISDTGSGIAPDELDNLFEAFVQTTTGRSIQEGTGLGLPISRKFVQLMGGDITVKSERGKGTTFTFEIQAELADQSTIDNRQSSISKRVVALEPDQPRYRILIVDEKDENRQILVKLLQPLEFDLREAKNGREAIDIWKEWEPHLIWMDILMPVMDGYEATKRIRELETGNSKLETRTVIIALTASVFEEEQATALSAGCDDFLLKPFRDVALFDLIHKYLGVRFVYEEEPQVAGRRSQVASEEMLTPEALAGLPDELRSLLQEAVETLDMDMTSTLIERIREQNISLADAIEELVKSYRFDTLQQLFEKSEDRKNEKV